LIKLNKEEQTPTKTELKNKQKIRHKTNKNRREQKKNRFTRQWGAHPGGAVVFRNDVQEQQ